MATSIFEPPMRRVEVMSLAGAETRVKTSSSVHRMPDFANPLAHAPGIIDPIDPQAKKLPRTVSPSSCEPQFFHFWWREHALKKSVHADFSRAENQNNK